jgi:acyl-CoA hydrolase
MIAEQIVERIPNGATLQIGVGGSPNAVLSSLRAHRDLGIHTECLSNGVVDLVDRGIVTNTRKAVHPNKIVTTFARGTRELYEWVHENSAVEFLPVDYVNAPRVVAHRLAHRARRLNRREASPCATRL